MATLWYAKPSVGWTQITGLTIFTAGGLTESDVNFYDYDGTLIAAYTLAEASALSAFPSAPDHSGDTVPLTFQEWNHTLSQVTAETKKLDVGVTEAPTDGKTHLIVRTTTVSGGSPTFYFTKSNATDTLEIDYGDGQSDSDSTNASVSFTPTNPLSNGDHDVTVWISSGSGTYTFGQNSTSTTVVGGSTDAYRQTLIEVYIGDDVTSLGNYAFYYCKSLSKITIPNTVVSIGEYALAYCISLLAVMIPDSVTTIYGYAFAYCTGLEKISLPESLTTIYSNVFYIVSSITSLVFPASLATISTYTCFQCHGIKNIALKSGLTTINSTPFYEVSVEELTIPSSVNRIDGLQGMTECLSFILEPTSPPGLSGGAFTGINSIAKIYVPSASLSTYQAATNWSTYASYMEGY